MRGSPDSRFFRFQSALLTNVRSDRITELAFFVVIVSICAPHKREERWYREIFRILQALINTIPWTITIDIQENMLMRIIAP